MITLSPWIIYYLTMSDNILYVLNVIGWGVTSMSTLWFVFTFPFEIDGVGVVKNAYSYGGARGADTAGSEKKETEAVVKKWCLHRRFAVVVVLFGVIMAILAQVLPDKKSVMTMLAVSQTNRVEFVNNLPTDLLKLFVEVYGGNDKVEEKK